MNCDRVKQKLVFYVDGSLSETERNEISQHLKQCDTCEADYRTTVEMVESARKMKIPEHDDMFWNVHYQMTMSRIEQKHHRRTLIKTLKLASGVIGVLLLFFVSRSYIEKSKPENFVSMPVGISDIAYNILYNILPSDKLPIPVEQLQNVVDLLEPEEHMIILTELLR
ncbi:MAG TPA: zf-HC2 domain-containing protein [bacterium]|nr:zf-HC2 domain-containing protein [bacterium]